MTNETFMSEYGFGRGILTYDAVSLDRNTSHIQPFLRMTQNEGFRYLRSDGVVVRYRQGLASSRLSEGYPTLLDSLKKQGVIDRAAFALHLENELSSSNETSMLTFGSWNWEKYALSPPKYVRLASRSGLWEVGLNGFKVEGELISESALALVSSSSSDILLPPHAYSLYSDTICQQVKCVHSWMDFSFDCQNGEEQQLPDITFLLGGHEFSVSSSLYIRKHAGKCESAVSASDLDFYVLGITFMWAYYTIFDMEKEQIGFARSVNYPYLPSTSSTLYWIWGGAFALLLMCVVIVAYTRRRPTPIQDPIIKPLIPREF